MRILGDGNMTGEKGAAVYSRRWKEKRGDVSNKGEAEVWRCREDVGRRRGGEAWSCGGRRGRR
jgi:hypothetical protein